MGLSFSAAEAILGYKRNNCGLSCVDVGMEDHSPSQPGDFDAFVANSADWLGRVAFALVGDRADAEDLVQETLLKVYKHWPRVRLMESPHAYVRRCLVNENVSAHRRPSPHLLPLTASDGLEHGVGSEAEHVTMLEDRDAVWQALATLSARQRSALVLRYYEGCSDEEISRILRCRRTTVRSLVYRGLAALRASFETAAECSATEMK